MTRIKSRLIVAIVLFAFALGTFGGLIYFNMSLADMTENNTMQITVFAGDLEFGISYDCLCTGDAHEAGCTSQLNFAMPQIHGDTRLLARFVRPSARQSSYTDVEASTYFFYGASQQLTNLGFIASAQITIRNSDLANLDNANATIEFVAIRLFSGNNIGEFYDLITLESFNSHLANERLIANLVLGILGGVLLVASTALILWYLNIGKEKKQQG